MQAKCTDIASSSIDKIFLFNDAMQIHIYTITTFMKSNRDIQFVFLTYIWSCNDLVHMYITLIQKHSEAGGTAPEPRMVYFFHYSEMLVNVLYMYKIHLRSCHDNLLIKFNVMCDQSIQTRRGSHKSSLCLYHFEMHSIKCNCAQITKEP